MVRYPQILNGKAPHHLFTNLTQESYGDMVCRLYAVVRRRTGAYILCAVLRSRLKKMDQRYYAVAGYDTHYGTYARVIGETYDSAQEAALRITEDPAGLLYGYASSAMVSAGMADPDAPGDLVDVEAVFDQELAGYIAEARRAYDEEVVLERMPDNVRWFAGRMMVPAPDGRGMYDAWRMRLYFTLAAYREYEGTADRGWLDPATGMCLAEMPPWDEVMPREEGRTRPPYGAGDLRDMFSEYPAFGEYGTAGGYLGRLRARAAQAAERIREAVFGGE